MIIPNRLIYGALSRLVSDPKQWNKLGKNVKVGEIRIFRRKIKRCKTRLAIFIQI